MSARGAPNGSRRAIQDLDNRHTGFGGELAHGEAVFKHRQDAVVENKRAESRVA